MNPWEIVGWIVAVCTAAVVVAFTLAILAALVTGALTRGTSGKDREVFRGDGK